MSDFLKKVQSVHNSKCPRCLQGDLYPTKLLQFKGWFTMNKRCSHCNLRYELEPGFYWGAMYMGYMVSTVFIFGFFALFYFLFSLAVTQAFFASVFMVFLLYGYIFRMARNIWLVMYVNYDEQYAHTKEGAELNH